MSTGNLPGAVTEDDGPGALSEELKAALEEIFTSKLTVMAQRLRGEVREDMRDILASLSADLLQRVGSGASRPPRRMSSTSTGGESKSSQSPSGIVSERETFPSKNTSKTGSRNGEAPKSEWMVRHRKSFVAGANGLGLQRPSFARSATMSAVGSEKTKAFKVGATDGPAQIATSMTTHDGHLHVPCRRGSRSSSARSPTSNRSPRSPLSPPTVPFEVSWQPKHPQAPSESPRPQDLRSNAATIHGSPQHLDVEAEHGGHTEVHNGAHSDGATHFGHPLHLNPANHVHGTMSWPVRHQGTESETSCTVDKDVQKHGPHVMHHASQKAEKPAANCRTLTFEETIHSRETIQSDELPGKPPESKRISSDVDEMEMRDTFVSLHLGDGRVGREDSRAGGTSSKVRLFRGESHVAGVMGDLRGVPLRDHSVHSNFLAKLRSRLSPVVTHEYFDLTAGYSSVFTQSYWAWRLTMRPSGPVAGKLKSCGCSSLPSPSASGFCWKLDFEC